MTQPAWSESQLALMSANIGAGLVSQVTLPAGLESQDGSAALGLNGHLFLTGGTNKLSDLYDAPIDGALREKAAAWVSVFDERQKESAARGLRYVQLVIPEKLSVLHEFAMLPVIGPTTMLKLLEETVDGRNFYLGGWALLKDWSGMDDPYLSTDTHLSAIGAQRIMAALTLTIDPALSEIVEAVANDSIRYAKGDLADRFHGLPLQSKVMEPGPEVFAEYRHGMEMVERYFPANGATGRRFRWVNTSSPSPKKVLVFGNSFFSIGDHAGLLSWWGKHLFREFHFVWDPEIDWALVDRLAPDVVIGQTVERFLPVVPTK